MGKKKRAKQKKEKKSMKQPIINEWNEMERYMLTKDVMDKLKELGIGVYVEQCDELETIIGNYVRKKEECIKKIDLPGTDRVLDINLQLTKQKNPVICLRCIT